MRFKDIFLSKSLAKNCPWCCGCDRDDDGDASEKEVIVYMNSPEANAPFKYPDNFIKTSEYTVLTFLPLALLMQFKKVSNIYFLLNMVCTLIPSVSPFSPVTTVAPFLFVITVALIKEGAEEFRRHRADNRANSILVDVLRNGEVISIPSKRVRTGDIIRVRNGEEIRADILLLSSSEEEGQAFIDTCNLDGEVSLKSRKAIEATWYLCTPEELTSARLVMHTTPPDPGLHTWNGKIDLADQEFSVDINQFLYRGCVLRKTDWVWGFAIYTGKNTKMFRNLKKRPPKVSYLDKKLNRMIIGIFLFQNAFLCILTFLAIWWNRHHKKHWYISWYIQRHTEGKLFIYRYITYFILLSCMIPISLFVTIEVCKVIQAYWMRRDKNMIGYVNGKFRHCVPNTCNLNEQLAMVRFIFSDKTGTLTENVMEFRKGDIKGHRIDADDLHGSRALLEKEGPIQDAAIEYFLALSLCHTIQPFSDSNSPFGVVYEGSSPDEVALVKIAAEHGFRLVSRTSRVIKVEIGGELLVCDILATLEFTPERKMMSIIVKNVKTGRITLYTKGADSSVKAQLSPDPEVLEYMDSVSVSLLEMSCYGLRTLLLAARHLSQESFDAWNAKFVEAGKTLVRRSEAVDKVCLEIEQNLRLLGAIAIEDKLQDQVPETVSFFLDAGVVIWMLTGDKRETALTIAATARLCDPRKDYIDHIDIGSLSPKDPAAVEKVGVALRQIELHVEEGEKSGRRCTFVVDGPALTIAMSETYFSRFLRVSKEVNSAVCCRLTPLQKANVVRMFQRETGLTALAVGDGANDVSMIQEARVGIGIMGVEGAQAALTADYAIPRFKNLSRLCAVHGRYCIVRNSSCILISFYKNLTLTLIQIVFAFQNGFSGLSLFDGWLLTFYNVVLTSISPVFLGIFEKDLPAEILLTRPKLLALVSQGLYFDFFTLLRWGAETVVHAIGVYYTMYPTLYSLDHTASERLSGSMVGTMMLFVLVCIVLCRIGLQIRYWRLEQVGGIGSSAVFLLVLMFAYSYVFNVADSTIYMHIYVIMSGAKFWFYLLLLVGSFLFIDLSILYFQKRFFPSLRDTAENENLMNR